MMRAKIIQLCLFLLVSAVSVRADAFSDFSLASNPNGNWTYGFTSTLGGTYSLLPTAAPGYFGVTNAWLGIGVSGFFGLGVYQFTGSVPASISTITFQPGLLDIHPGGTFIPPTYGPSQFVVVRWTAPSAGTYMITGLFTGIDVTPTTSDVYVLMNSTNSLFTGNINSYSVPLNFSPTVALAGGDTIDFVAGVGSDGNFLSDNVGFNAKISAVANPVPEPTSLVLFGSSLVSLFIRPRKNGGRVAHAGGGFR
jgi:hypothetical protein